MRLVFDSRPVPVWDGVGALRPVPVWDGVGPLRPVPVWDGVGRYARCLLDALRRGRAGACRLTGAERGRRA
jgi:hypothetical protein